MSISVKVGRMNPKRECWNDEGAAAVENKVTRKNVLGRRETDWERKMLENL